MTATVTAQYPTGMAELIDDIRELGNEIRDLDAQRARLLDRRRALVLEARAEGITWRSLAAALGMTEHGLIKMTKSKDRADD